MPDHDSKRCSKCGEIKPLGEFSRESKARDGLRYWCRACSREANLRSYAAGRDARREQAHQYYEANRERARQQQRRYRQANRDTVFAHYGRSCACCGETENLTIDHVNGDGARQRQELYQDPTQGSTRFYIWLIKHGFPPGIQTLCHRCNKSKSNGERCRIDHDLEQDVENDAW